MTIQVERLSMHINGQQVRSTSGETTKILDPSNNQVIAEVDRGTRDNAQAAVEAARQALTSQDWREIDPSKRVRMLFKFATLVRENSDELARLETVNVGKPLRESKGDVAWAARTFEYFAGLADKIEGETIPVPPKRLNYTLKEPLGVTVHIVPWNYPIALTARSVAPALAAGNSVIIKPSELTPLTALRLGDLALKAGFPKGIVNVVTGAGSEIGMELVSNKDVDGVVFTGSAETGVQVMATAAKNVTPVVLELGGKNPQIVFADADLPRAVKSVQEGIFTNAGQMCWAGSRAIIHESIYESFMKELATRTRSLKLGPGTDESTNMGPMVSRRQQETVMGFIKDGVDEGGKVLVGGSKPPGLDNGNYVQPTIFDGVESDMRIGREEIFGPVLCTSKFSTLDQAVGLANDSQYGLYAGVWTNNVKVAHEMASRLQVGVVAINEYLVTFPQTPFGGYKESGIGHENGIHSLQYYTRTKNVSVSLA